MPSKIRLIANADKMIKFGVESVEMEVCCMKLTRRQLLVGLLGLGAGSALPVSWVTAKTRGTKSTFAPDRRLALAAATERILPGAIDAGVPDYIDYWMQRAPFEQFVEPLFRIGSVHLDRIARHEHGKVFARCSSKVQDDILRRFQKGEVRAKKFQSKAFFEHLVRFTLEGFLGDPKYGGNKNRIGWNFIGRPQGHPGCWWEPRDFRIDQGRLKGLPW